MFFCAEISISISNVYSEACIDCRQGAEDSENLHKSTSNFGLR